MIIWVPNSNVASYENSNPSEETRGPFLLSPQLRDICKVLPSSPRHVTLWSVTWVQRYAPNFQTSWFIKPPLKLCPQPHHPTLFLFPPCCHKIVSLFFFRLKTSFNQSLKEHPLNSKYF